MLNSSKNLNPINFAIGYPKKIPFKHYEKPRIFWDGSKILSVVPGRLKFFKYVFNKEEENHYFKLKSSNHFRVNNL